MERIKPPAETSSSCQWADIALTPLEDDDIDRLHIWQNSPAVRDLTMAFRLPVRKGAVRAWLDGLRADGGNTRAVYGIRQNGALVGTAQLNGIDPIHRTASLGIYVGEPGDRSRGAGRIACSLILDYGFNALNLHRIGLEVVASSLSAVALYEKLGFVREGTKRKEYFADGVYHDVLIYGLLRDEFAVTIPGDAHRLALRQT
jgi:diamine N-acetyltransferase